jgi:hypothetical protein
VAVNCCVLPGAIETFAGVTAIDDRTAPEIVKLAPLLFWPPTLTTTLPVVAPFGTVTVMLVALQLVAVAATPLNFTVLVPCVAPKFVPVIVTEAPTDPEVGLRVVIVGVATVSVKFTPLLTWPPTVTTTLPVVAPLGTVTVMLVALQLVAVAATPLNFTVLVPCVAPNFVPVIVTTVPTTPVFGLKLLILGPDVPPPPVAARNVATCAVHPPFAAAVHDPATAPALPWISYSVASHDVGVLLIIVNPLPAVGLLTFSRSPKVSSPPLPVVTLPLVGFAAVPSCCAPWSNGLVVAAPDHSWQFIASYPPAIPDVPVIVTFPALLFAI